MFQNNEGNTIFSKNISKFPINNDNLISSNGNTDISYIFYSLSDKHNEGGINSRKSGKEFLELRKENFEHESHQIANDYLTKEIKLGDILKESLTIKDLLTYKVSLETLKEKYNILSVEEGLNLALKDLFEEEFIKVSYEGLKFEIKEVFNKIIEKSEKKQKIKVSEKINISGILPNDISVEELKKMICYEFNSYLVLFDLFPENILINNE